MVYIIIVITEAIPGSIRKAEYFISFMKRFNEYLKVYHCSLVVMVIGDVTDEVTNTEGSVRESLIISSTLSTISVY